MGRRPEENPTPKRSIQVSDSFWKFALRYRNDREPMYLAMDRLMGYYNQGKAEVVQQKENLTKVNQIYLQRIHELEKELQDSKKYSDQLEVWRV